MTELYVRKSDPVEARQFTGGDLDAAEIDSWLDLWGDVKHVAERFVDSKEPQYIGGEMLIPVLQFPEHLMIMADSGNYHVPLNSWLVKDSSGVLQVMTDEAFNNAYERFLTSD